MKNLIEEIKEYLSCKISDYFKEKYGFSEDICIQSIFEIPPDDKLGDLSFPCFIFSKSLKKSPNNISLELNEFLQNSVIDDFKLISQIKSVGPYVNFYFDNNFFSKEVLKNILKNEKSNQKKKNIKKQKTIVLEFPAPNTNKPLHLGHVRNMLLGETLSKLYELGGCDVKRVNLNNDRGIHICKSMIAYQKYGDNKKPDKKSDHFVGDFYVLYNQKLKEDENLEKETKEMLQKWENKDPDVRALWKKMNTWAFEGFKQTYSTFGISFDKEYYESLIYEKGKEIVLDAYKNNVFEKDETGAIVADLGDLGKKVLLRSDGTSIYITQDIYLAKQKYDDFKYDESIYVVGNEQIHHFKALFKVFEILDFPFANKCKHLSYGMIELPEGKMKSREGKVVDADMLFSEVYDLAKDEICKRAQEGRNDLKENEIDETAKEIALSAINFYMLKYSPIKNFVFNPSKSISFEGETGPYCQYAYVRANKILDKVNDENTSISLDFDYDLSSYENSLVKELAKYPLVTQKARLSLSPNLICEYAYNLSKTFNSFYENEHILNEENKEKQKQKILILKAFILVLKQTLGILGINVVKQM